MIIHLGDTSDYKQTDGEEFWSLSEDEWMEGMVQISVCFLFIFF
jgi:hypothetical protein